VIICDTGPLVALLNKADNDHEACARLFATYPGRLIVPGPVLTEVCYMAESRLGSETEARFLDSMAAGEFELESVAPADLRRMAGLVRTYADFPLGAADASVVAIAERLGATRVATLDHRHFRAVRPVHCPAFELLPAA
jgi:predicted nucleic acid-binding protein